MSVRNFVAWLRLSVTAQGSAPAMRAGQPLSFVNTTASHVVDHGFGHFTAHQFTPGLHEVQLKHLGLDLDVIRVSLSARGLLSLATKVTQVCHAAQIELKAASLLPDHAFGFALADVGPAAIKV
jgi:hypothetical protein